MPTARGFAGAATTSTGLFVIGGTQGGQPLAVTERYQPDQEGHLGGPWQTRASMPQGRQGMGSVSLADVVYIMGGETSKPGATPLAYLPIDDEWRILNLPGQPANWSNLALIGLDNNLHALGGRQGASPTSEHLKYQILYSVLLPVITR
jgi:hypothetical protein